MSWFSAAGLVMLGIAGLFVLSFLETRWIAQQPWGRAVRTEDYTIQSAAAIATWNRTLPLAQSAGNSEIVQSIQRDLVAMAAEGVRTNEKSETPVEGIVNPFDTSQRLDLSYLPRATLVMAALSPEALASLLGSGRLPETGKREVLAGPLLADDEITLDDETFSVVGHIDPTAAGFVKTYLLPADPALEALFAADNGGTRGSIYANTDGDIVSLIPELESESRADIPTIHGRPVQTRTFIAWGVWWCLLGVATGATVGFIALYRRLAQTHIPVLATAMRETVLRPRLIVGLHVFLFAAFFGAMALGMQDPELNHLFTEYTAHTFTEGGLKYVGDAYYSGDIPRAAHATFNNNFVMQTLVLTVGASVVPPFFLGVLKILLSFVVVGFAMAPIWTETAGGMTYHAITLALELPPYILMSFGASVWALYVLQFLWSPIRAWYLGESAAGEPIIEDAARQLPRGLLVLVGCTGVTGVFLYVAAWYEAVTLIMLR